MLGLPGFLTSHALVMSRGTEEKLKKKYSKKW